MDARSLQKAMPSIAKQCSVCQEIKSLEDFHRLSNARDGRNSRCKPCQIRAVMDSRHRHMDRQREYDRQYRDLHLEEARAREADYNQRNRDKRSAYSKRHYKINREARRKAAREYRLANPERERRYSASKRARKLDAFVEHVDHLVVLERHDGVCGICGGDVDPLDFHVDHIIALSRGGEHSYSNTQPAHPTCNMRKGTRVM